jgi:predicted acylesterase/phospholipase RssA/CRP-like cAMP-binding protein
LLASCNYARVQEMRRYLASTELLRDLDEATFESLAAELEWISVGTNDVLMREGEDGDSLFILLSGRLRVFLPRDDHEIAVGEISPGEAVGEMAIIGDERRSATVRAVRPSTLVRLTRTGFERLEERHPNVMRHMAKLLVRRLRDVNAPRERRSPPLTIGIIAGAPDFQVSGVVERLVKALSAVAPTCHLNADIVDSQLSAGIAQAPAGSEESLRLANWLAGQERGHRFVVYEAGAPSSNWTQQVIHHSDRLMIAVPGDVPPESKVSGFLDAIGVNQSAAQKDLVLVHSATTRVAGDTSLWMRYVPAAERFHVWLYSSHDFERLARVVSGRAMGLVLGGGGARGFAHIGVVRALTEARVPIDFVGGTSIGAMIAAQVAMDWDVPRMLETNRDLFRKHPLHGDYTMPVVSSHTQHKALRLYELMFGDQRIEDQWRNFFCVACNLTRGEAVIHRAGRFHDAVEASSALPIVNAPVLDKGEMIVDGALINNLPADVMKSLCGGTVIAVDVSPRRDLRAATGEKDLKSNPRIVRAGPPSAATGLPSVSSIVMRTVMLNTVLSVEAMKKYIDVHLKPPVEHIEMFDWMAIDDVAETGYRYTADMISRGLHR